MVDLMIFPENPRSLPIMGNARPENPRTPFKGPENGGGKAFGIRTRMDDGTERVLQMTHAGAISTHMARTGLSIVNAGSDETAAGRAGSRWLRDRSIGHTSAC